jgi:Uma2 family endonuclease
MVVQPKLMTVEAFWAEYAGKPFELVQGEVVAIMPTGYVHGAVVMRIGPLLREFVNQHALGDIIGGETGFYLSENNLRGANIAFISNAKLSSITDPEKYLPFAPDLAVEVVSPSDTATAIQQKVDLYLSKGTALVWVVYPDLRKVAVHYPDGHSKSLTDKQVLDGEEVLPGLSIPVRGIFPQRKNRRIPTTYGHHRSAQ